MQKAITDKFINEFIKPRKTYSISSSYGIKHRFEQWHKDTIGGNGYITNIDFHKAMESNGYIGKPQSEKNGDGEYNYHYLATCKY